MWGSDPLQNKSLVLRAHQSQEGGTKVGVKRETVGALPVYTECLSRT